MSSKHKHHWHAMDYTIRKNIPGECRIIGWRQDNFLGKIVGLKKLCCYCAKIKPSTIRFHFGKLRKPKEIGNSINYDT